MDEPPESLILTWFCLYAIVVDDFSKRPDFVRAALTLPYITWRDGLHGTRYLTFILSSRILVSRTHGTLFVPVEY
jgi:hypothetical protein